MNKVTLKSVATFAQGLLNILKHKANDGAKLIELLSEHASMYDLLQATIKIDGKHFYMHVGAGDCVDYRVEAGSFSLQLKEGLLTIGGLTPSDERFEDYRQYLIQALEEFLDDQI